MQRVDNSPDDLFENGDPAVGTTGTRVMAEWLNAIQEELAKIVEASDLTLDSNDNMQVWIALKQNFEMPFAAIAKPVIDTADNTIGATGAVATNGGTVSVAADKKLTIVQEVAAGLTGRLRTFTTAAYTSADLAVSSTYYLRAQVDANGSLVVYTQKGTDADAVPAGLKGTVDGASGGGFPSTVLDILLAKIVTGVAASTPTVTNIPNARIIGGYFSVMEE